MKFDLMTKRPKLNTQTLNYVWDRLWRMNYIPSSNKEERIRASERERIMSLLVELATSQEEGNK